MCYVSSTELKKNLSHYMSLCQKENVYVTKSGKIIGVIVNPKDQAYRDLFAFADSVVDKEPDLSYEDCLYQELLKR